MPKCKKLKDPRHPKGCTPEKCERCGVWACYWLGCHSSVYLASGNNRIKGALLCADCVEAVAAYMTVVA
jgi:hypothetical protein